LGWGWGWEQQQQQLQCVCNSALTLFESNMMLGDLLLSQPLSTLALFDRAIQSVAQSLMEGSDDDVKDMVR